MKDCPNCEIVRRGPTHPAQCFQCCRMIYRDRTEQLASDLLSREYGKDHPAARHTFALTFRTTTHAHQVRELASALRRAEARAWREAAKLTMELAPPGVRLPLRDEFLERADALEKAGGER